MISRNGTQLYPRVPCGFGAMELAHLRQILAGLHGVPDWVTSTPDWRLMPSGVRWVDVQLPRESKLVLGPGQQPEMEMVRVEIDKRFPTNGTVPYVDEVRMGWSERGQLVLLTVHIRP